MKKNTTIHTYNFSCSDFTDVGITALAKAIQDSPNITSINLGYNEFSFLAFLNISNAIREHPGLRQLLIYGPYNFIDKDIADVLSLALENNNRIEYVCFEETEFSFDAAQLFLRRLKNHPSIDINRLSYEIINNETFSYDQKNSLRNSLSD